MIKAVLSVFLGGMFFVSAIPKLRHPKGFILTVLEYRILPQPLGKAYGVILPPLEFFLALCACTGFMLRLTTLIMALLLLSFIIAVSINMKRGRDLDCGCFGRLKRRRIGKGLLLQNMMVLSSILLLLLMTHTWVAIEGWSFFSFICLHDWLIVNFLCIGVTLVVSIILRAKKLPQFGQSLQTTK